MSTSFILVTYYGANNCCAANETKRNTPQETVAQELAERTEQLKKAESAKWENPEAYIYALTTMQSAVKSDDFVNKNKKESPDADRYFDLAVNYFLATKLDSTTNERIACHLWQTSGNTSLKEFKAVFDRLCRATSRALGDNFGAADSDMRQALMSRSNMRANGIPIKEQIQLTQRAIEIRSAAMGPRSKTLSNLLFSSGRYHEELGEIALAEQYYLKNINLDSEDSSKASKWQTMADFYLRHHEATKAIAAWRTGAKIAHGNFYAEGEINLINEFKKTTHPEYADEIINTLLANGNSRVFDKFDSYLLDAVDQNIKNTNFKKAQDLIQKRIAAGKRVEITSGLADWKLRLSNVLLAQGESKESDELFKQVLGSMALQGIQTDDLRRDRATLLERMGDKSKSERMTKALPKTSTAIIMKSPLMATEAIIFGHNSSVTYFNSSDPPAPPHQLPPSPKAPRSPRPPGPPVLMIPHGFRGPKLPPEETILSLGQIRMEDNYLDVGNIFTRDPALAERYRVGKAELLPTGFTINDALSPPSGTAVWNGRDTSGDFIVTAPNLAVMGQKGATTALRLFLVDSPNNNGFDIRIDDLYSFKQLQIWYNGSKKISLHSASGFIYAPHVVVEITFNSTFKGSIVAKRVVCLGNNSINLDKAIVNQNFNRR